MREKNYLVSGELTNTDVMMNDSLWIGVCPELIREILDFAVDKIESYLGLNF